MAKSRLAGKKEQDKQEQLQQLAQEIHSHIKDAKQIRIQWEAWIATIQTFTDGNHRLWWDDRGQFHRKELQDNEIWRTINLFPIYLEARQTRLTKNDPHWFVKPSLDTEVSQDEIDAANTYLQIIYREEKWKDKLKMILKYGDMRGMCPVVVGWDQETGKPTLEYYDPWDFYPDVSGANPCDWQWLIVSAPKSLGWLKTQTIFTQEQLEAMSPERRNAQSGVKDMWMRQRTGFTAPAGTVMLNQYFKKETVRGGKINLYYECQGQVSDPVELDYDDFDDFLEVYRPVLSDFYYSRPPCAEWIDPQKSINKIYSNIESYLDLFGQGRWRRTDKTVTIPYGGQHGQIIDAVIGDIEQFPMQPLPQTHREHLNMALMQFEQLAGVHSESLGRISGTANAGVAIEDLTALDEQNSAGPLDNLHTFLERIGEKILRMANQNLKKTTTIYQDNKLGYPIRLDIIGGAAYDTRKELADTNIIPIRDFSNIESEVIPGGAFSEAAKQSMIKELLSFWQPGQNPVTDRLIIDNWTIGVQREVTKLLENLSTADKMIATGENEKMAGGQFVTPNASDNHAVHVQIHNDKLQELQKLGQKNQIKLLLDHIASHNIIAQQQTQGPMEPPKLPQAK